ncbi:hypothetical protein Glove_194g88 [Diversispora epigaea]|uniref:Uncharacterized protein n=1 Tax=Diversispora epigaea TaxID=1348612 RepID=A0A397IUY1_9GLOM|nr:hypothetical protein Glove_194g88 [Diversispora epigaea]
MSQIFIPDPIGINPNSIANVRKVLEHIEEIAEIKNGSCKWVVVTCDGVPYHHIQKIKKDFPWLILIPDALHEEMNMLRATVHMSQIFIPDPIGINPNSIANVRKVLEHIEEIAEIKNGSCKWVVVTCDGVPYHHIQKIKKDFPWLILIPDALHEEMNMLRAFVELNWDIDIRDFAQN